jgi:hypothetical protein
MGRTLERAQGADAAIAFLQEKAGIVSYLPTTPLLFVTLSLGDMHTQKRQAESAANCYRSVVNSEPVDRMDEQGLERSIRREAAEKLSRLGSKVPPAASPEPSSAGARRSEIGVGAFRPATARWLISILCFVAGVVVADIPFLTRFYRVHAGSAIPLMVAVALAVALGARTAGWRGAVLGALGAYISLQVLFSIAHLGRSHGAGLLVYCLLWGLAYGLAVSYGVRHFLYPCGEKVRLAAGRLAAGAGLLLVSIFLTDLLPSWRGLWQLMHGIGLTPLILIKLLHLR